jgi:hypothetical protein
MVSFKELKTFNISIPLGSDKFILHQYFVKECSYFYGVEEDGIINNRIHTNKEQFKFLKMDLIDKKIIFTVTEKQYERIKQYSENIGKLYNYCIEYYYDNIKQMNVITEISIINLEDSNGK